MKSIGIITIHKINNYGSVLQAYALQQVCKQLGYEVEIIDYNFPNEFHRTHSCEKGISSVSQKSEPTWIKALFSYALIKQHKGISKFVKERLSLSDTQYDSPEQLKDSPPHYDIYITGSDQLWSPRYCKGDPSFMLHFAPDDSLKISYAASIGADSIPNNLINQYKSLLNRYRYISVREQSGAKVIDSLIRKKADVVLDPTLLLNHTEWNKIAYPKRLVKKKYILCYFLNYSFDAFPYVDQLANDIKQQTGYELVRVARPPHKLSLSDKYYIGASPEEFLALVRDAEIVLTTSFHGTAFAVNFGRPVFTIVQNLSASDSRQVNLMKSLNLNNQIIPVNSAFPDVVNANYDANMEQYSLQSLRKASINYLKKALQDE